MHDIADLEMRGVPAMFVASDEFVSAADSQSRALGFPDLKRIFTGHPVQDRTDDEMREMADRHFPDILACIVQD